MTEIDLWGVRINGTLLSNVELDYIRSMPSETPSLEWLWAEMDRVWDSFGLNNRLPLSYQPIAEFYRHPVWLVNGIFTRMDSVSRDHRESISEYLARKDLTQIADFGGGFGQLALALSKRCRKAMVSIIEPFPSKIGIEQLKDNPRIEFVPTLDLERYDAIIAQDVLEHVEDPVGLAYEIVSATKVGGTIIFANCFYPVIRCHLPATFHLRTTFPWVMKALGIHFIGTVEGAPHAQVFNHSGILDLASARKAEAISKRFGPYLNIGHAVFGRFKKAIL